MTTDELFAQVAERLQRESGIQERTGFSTDPGLRVRGKLFAMLRDGELVVKLPASRAHELVAAHAAKHFYRSQVLPLKRWVSIGHDSAHDWLEITEEALKYARAVQTADRATS